METRFLINRAALAGHLSLVTLVLVIEYDVPTWLVVFLLALVGGVVFSFFLGPSNREKSYPSTVRSRRPR